MPSPDHGESRFWKRPTQLLGGVTMAHFHRRRGTNRVYVYYWNGRAGKLVQLPRAETEHLDEESDRAVNLWVRQWEKDHGREKAIIKRVKLGRLKLAGLWAAYLKHQEDFNKCRQTTLKTADEIFHNHIVPYFVGTLGVKDPTQWHPYVTGFLTHLKDVIGLKDLSIKKVLQVLTHFGWHLVYTSKMSYGFTVKAPKAKNHKMTPLKRPLAPDEVLNAVLEGRFERTYKKAHPPNLSLAVLIAYFASLGPEELWPLEKADFRGGEIGASRSKTYQHFTATHLPKMKGKKQ